MISKNRVIKIVALILTIIGIGLIIYPYAAQSIFDHKVQSDYKNWISQTSNSQNNGSDNNIVLYKQLYNDMVTYNNTIREEGQSKLTNPSAYERASFDLKQYGLKENIIGYINIPKIDVTLPIYLGASKENMTKGAAHLSQTSLPIGGLGNNSVICGHRGYWGGKMFKHLVDLRVGDEVSITNLWYTIKYRVTDTMTILESDVDALKIQDGKDKISLFTCYYQSGRKDRFVVCCERIYE